MTSSPRLSHYQILNLSRNSPPSSQDVKRAYHRALLEHHPDKIRSVELAEKALKDAGPLRNNTRSPLHSAQIRQHNINRDSPSIDQIIAAYTILSDSSLRAEYDASLNGATISSVNLAIDERGHIGVEKYDLDDLDHHTDTNGLEVWSKSCRCGNEEGYTVTDKQLEEASNTGTDEVENEIYIGCNGCSLFIKIVFAVQCEE